MKNWEFYEEQVRENPYFAYTKREIRPCGLTVCSKCDFFDEDNDNCMMRRIEFLYQDYKRTVVLTDDEKALCKLLGSGWIARDLDEKLWWYKKKPTKGTAPGAWLNRSCSISGISDMFPQCKFDFIKWEDEEPWEVQVND